MSGGDGEGAARVALETDAHDPPDLPPTSLPDQSTSTTNRQPPRDINDFASDSDEEAEIGVIRVGPHAQAVLPDCRPLPAAKGAAAAAADDEGRRLEAKPLFMPGDEERRSTRSSGVTAAAAKAAAAAVAASAAGAAKAASQAESAARALTRGKTGLQSSYAEWAGAISEMANEQQRQDLLSGALAQLDEEMGTELVQVRRPAAVTGVGSVRWWRCRSRPGSSRPP